MMRRRRVSVIAEWHKNLKYLKSRLLKTPATRPMPTDATASRMN